METSKALQLFDYIVIGGYFLILLGTATYFSKRMKLSSEFFTAGGNMPWWLAGVSFFMASHSALSFVMYGELGYKYGVTSITLFFCTLPALVLAGAYIAKRWRRSRTSTPVQFLERRYSLYMRQALAWTGFPLRIIDDALKIFSTAIFLYVGMKVDLISLSNVITFVGIVMVIYAMLGGQQGVIVTDFLQFIVKMVIVLVILGLTIYHFVSPEHPLAPFPPGFFDPLAGSYTTLNYLAFLFLMVVSMNTAWSLVQKYNCVGTEKDAQRVAWTVTILNCISPIIFFTPAILARAILPDLVDAKYSYAALAFTVLPTGMMGMLVAGMFASTISTMGSEFNVLAGILTNDLYQRIFKPHASEKELVIVGRIATIIIGCLIIGMSILLTVLKGMNIFDIMLKAFGALMPATALPIFVGFFWKRITARGALTGLIAGAITGIGLVFLNVYLMTAYSTELKTDLSLQYWLKQGWDSMAILVNIFVTVVAMLIGSLLNKPSDDEKKRVLQYFTDLRTPVSAEEIGGPPGSYYSNLQVMGIGTMLFGLLMLIVGLLQVGVDGDAFGITLNISTGVLVSLFGLILYKKTKPMPRAAVEVTPMPKRREKVAP
jgi:solute:Na+ symporter, SSS family